MYESFYAFSESPFGMTPNPHFLFPSKKHEEALAHLVYGITQRKGFVAVTGEVGAGKTTLCRALLERLPENHASALILNPAFSATELLRDIVRDFGLPGKKKTKRGLIEELNQFLLASFAQGRNAVVVIDECQDLESSVLEQIRLISNLETETTKLIQIVLVGQPELKLKLSQPELRQLEQRITVRYHLEALTEEETKEYIAHRLRIAGPNHKANFTKSSASKIHAYSRGIPRLINVLCDRTLLAGFVDGSLTLKPEHVAKAASEVRWELPSSRPLPRPGKSMPWIHVAGMAAALLLVGGTSGLLLRYRTVPAALNPDPSKPYQEEETQFSEGAIPTPTWSGTVLTDSLRQSVSACSLLMGLWQMETEPALLQDIFSVPSWDSLIDHGFLYHEVKTSKEELIALDVPLLLEIYEPDLSSSSWQVFLGVKDGRILLHNGTEEIHLSNQEFEQRWLARALLLWQDFDDLQNHEEGVLPLLDPSYKDSGNLDETLRLYQTLHGLTATGRLDPFTLVRVYADTYPSRVPRLLWTEVSR